MSRSDRLALDRAEQMLGAAPPAVVEQVHTEAFGRLTATERAAAFDRLTAASSGDDQPADPSAAALGRAAARVEARQRGGLAQVLGTDGPGAALSSAVSAAILGVVAGYAASSAAWEAWGAEGDEEPPSYGGGGIGDFGF